MFVCVVWYLLYVKCLCVLCGICYMLNVCVCLCGICYMLNVCVFCVVFVIC